MATALIEGLERELAARRNAGLYRVRRTLESAQAARVVIDGVPVLAFASNDYLGLAGDPAIIAAAREGALRWGVGAGASHLICGHQSPHEELETALAAFVAPGGQAQALLFSSGYLANLAILTTLCRRDTAVFADRLDHACLNDGAVLSRAQLVRYPHADVSALASRLATSTARRKVIATDAVFSMDGDLAPLPALLGLADAHDAWLVVDDAHGFGVLGEGRGTLAHFGLRSDRIVAMGTLGKAAGVGGAFVCAHPAVIETVLQVARPYIYTTAAPAMLACALLASLDAIAHGEARRARLKQSIDRLQTTLIDVPWRLLPSTTPIQALVVGDNAAAMALSARLWSQRIFVPAIRPPTVPPGTARLRISLSAAHVEADIDELVAALRAAC
jgi:8-amino-7-oxononanoate synthase